MIVLFKALCEWLLHFVTMFELHSDGQLNKILSLNINFMEEVQVY